MPTTRPPFGQVGLQQERPRGKRKYILGVSSSTFRPALAGRAAIDVLKSIIVSALAGSYSQARIVLSDSGALSANVALEGGGPHLRGRFVSNNMPNVCPPRGAHCLNSDHHRSSRNGGVHRFDIRLGSSTGIRAILACSSQKGERFTTRFCGRAVQ